ncbi:MULTISPECIES: hypothetical protein [unclassified Rhizobium]|uniref:hypothetical protein n=1 Tax=unclassified Rhizobium TaxID=2613769 RepID=UPI0011C392EC|nr:MULTISPECIES: hypothetical protein [unclassified Rhizobium]
MNMLSGSRRQSLSMAEIVSAYCSLISGTADDLLLILGSSRLLHRQPLDSGNISCLNMPRVIGTIPEGVTDHMKADPSPKFGRAVPSCVPRPDRFARLMPQGFVYA